MAIHKIEIVMDNDVCVAKIEGERIEIIRAMVELMLQNVQVRDIVVLAHDVYQQTFNEQG